MTAVVGHWFLFRCYSVADVFCIRDKCCWKSSACSWTGND